MRESDEACDDVGNDEECDGEHISGVDVRSIISLGGVVVRSIMVVARGVGVRLRLHCVTEGDMWSSLNISGDSHADVDDTGRAVDGCERFGLDDATGAAVEDWAGVGGAEFCVGVTGVVGIEWVADADRESESGCVDVKLNVGAIGKDTCGKEVDAEAGVGTVDIYTGG